MKFLLKKAGQSLYYTGQGRWLPELENAMVFASAREAMSVIRVERLNDVELLFHSGRDVADFVMRCPTQKRTPCLAGK